jgi:hypothetical protein
MAAKRLTSMSARREQARVRLRRLNRERAALLARFPELEPVAALGIKARLASRRSR